MINKLFLTNFKSHSSTNLLLSKVNILSGMNGMGKSSIMQSILLLRQTIQKGLLERGLDLNGDLCSIGTANDCIYQDAESNEIKIQVEDENGKNEFVYVVDPSNLLDTFIKKTSPITNLNLEKFAISNTGFQYISAFRNGPVNDYIKDTSSVELFNQISQREGRCELVAHYLHHNKDENVSDEICKPGYSKNLLQQVTAWMREISPDINLSIKPGETYFRLEYNFDRGKGSVNTSNFRASNIGFGISYALPIVVAILEACSEKAGKTKPYSRFILIENPEAHIHPSGQSKLMELISIGASLGIQYIIETHSDHIINGLLKTIKTGVLQAGDVEIHFFERDKKSHSTITHRLEITDDGNVKNTPQGFFDQIDLDMQFMLGI